MIPCLLAMGAAGLGSPALGWLRSERGYVRLFAAGLACAAFLLWGFGLCGLLLPLPAWCLTGLGTVLLFTALPGETARAIASARRGWTASLTSFMLAGIIAVVLVGTLVLSRIPPTLYDAIGGHLLLPQQFVIRHRVVAMPWFMPASWPFLVHGGFAWGLLLGGDWRGPGFLNWLHLGGVAVVVARIAGRAGSGVEGRLGAAVAWLLVPLAAAESLTPLSDLQPTLYAVLGVESFVGWWRRPTARLWLTAGLWGGLAGACKYTGSLTAVFVLAGLAGRTGLMAVRGRRVMAAGAVMAVPLLPVLAKNWFLAGAPLFPFLTDSEPARKYAAFARGYLIQRTPAHCLSVPFRIIGGLEDLFRNDIWEVGGILLVLYLVPLCLVGRGGGREPSRAIDRWLGATVLGSWVFGFLAGWAMRWMLPMTALAAVLWSRLAGRIRYGIPAMVALLAFANVPDLARPTSMIGGAMESWRLRVAVGGDEARFVAAAPRTAAMEGALQALAADTHSRGAVATWQEPRVYWAHARMCPSLMHDRSLIEDALERSVGAVDLRRRFRQAGVTHLFICVAVPPEMAAQYRMFVTSRELLLLDRFLATGCTPLSAQAWGRYRAYRIRSAG